MHSCVNRVGKRKGGSKVHMWELLGLGNAKPVHSKSMTLEDGESDTREEGKESVYVKGQGQAALALSCDFQIQANLIVFFQGHKCIQRLHGRVSELAVTLKRLRRTSVIFAPEGDLGGRHPGGLAQNLLTLFDNFWTSRLMQRMFCRIELGAVHAALCRCNTWAHEHMST
eukprot:1141208-Pelagomonas_calceolata.AAC.2